MEQRQEQEIVQILSHSTAEEIVLRWGLQKKETAVMYFLAQFTENTPPGQTLIGVAKVAEMVQRQGQGAAQIRSLNTMAQTALCWARQLTLSLVMFSLAL